VRQAVQRGPRSDSGARGDVEDASSRSAAASRAVEGRRHRGCVRALIYGDNDLFLGHAEAGGKVGSVAGPGGGGDDCVDVVDRQCRFDQALADRLAALIAASDPSTPTTTGADDFHMIRPLIPWAMHSPCPGRYWNP
jgi:hypothetical protein